MHQITLYILQRIFYKENIYKKRNKNMLLIKKLLSNRSQIIKQAKFTHCPFGKALEK